MLTQALAIELGPHGIRVNAVAPGLVTDAALTADDPSLTPYMRMMLDMTPVRRTGAPEDIAEVVAFVASERNAWMSGSIVDVSGGSHTGRPHVPLPRSAAVC
jgi:NAD(P)-dependent dehydrogenase (short-subunit alcohol dehydrogenase family)